MSRRVLAAAVLATVFAIPNLSHAQTVSLETTVGVPTSLLASLNRSARLAEDQVGVQLPLPRPAAFTSDSKVPSRSMLTSLYATTAALQMLDADSTLKSLGRGAVEINPLMSGLVKNRAAFFATKAGIAAATIYAAHKIAKNNKIGAALTLVAINSAYAMIVKHNYGIAGR